MGGLPLYTWKALFSKPAAVRNSEADLAAELRRVKTELVRVTEERDILKKAATYFHVLRARVPVKYGFIKDHQAVFSVRTMCHVLMVHEAARQDVFHYIEMFYNPKRKHTNNGLLSPVDFETRQQKLKTAGA